MPRWLSSQAQQQKVPPAAFYAQPTHTYGPNRDQPRSTMTTIEADKLLKEREESAVFADGLEEAFIGIGYQNYSPVAIYSKSKAIQCFIKEGMDEEQAYEYFDYNVAGAYVGGATPIFLEDDN